MGKRVKASDQEKITAVLDYFSGQYSCSHICMRFNITRMSLYRWIRIYKASGPEGFADTTTNYSEALKLNAVKDYLNGIASLEMICGKYKIATTSTLLSWIKKYNGYGSFNSHCERGDKHMANGRNTTYEEKIEIVAFCIANNDNYQMTSEKFQVSYQQVYSWVKKYKDSGFESLLDRRGKRKSLEEMNESEKVDAQLKLLESENKRLKMENDFLKKLKEVEGRR